MKIRIKGNSIRLRLTKTDVQSLKDNGLVEDKTIVNAQEIFSYALMTNHEIDKIAASFQNNKITVYLSKEEAKTLTETDEITVQGSQENGLFLLVEKDLQCLDTTSEDQSDMYQNTKTKC